MFYLTLPSNSSLQYYPENNASRFVTKLPQPQEYSGEYEVGLAEIQFNNTYFNIDKGTVYFTYTIPQQENNEDEVPPPIKTEMHEGLYESKKYFAHALNKLFEFLGTLPSGKRRIKCYYNQASKKASLTLYEPYGVIQLSEYLADILGLPSTLTGAGHFESDHLMDLNQNFKNVFVYCDLVQARPVGDAMVPLLRTLPPIDNKQDTVHHIFEKPHYIPLARFQFSTVEILLTTDTGKDISFDNGHTIVTLDFRRRRLT